MLLFPFKKQTGCVDAQLQRNPDHERREVRELCAICPRESGSAGIGFEGRRIRIQFGGT